MTSWISLRRDIYKNNTCNNPFIQITNDYEKTNSPDNLRTPLREHQKTALKAMLDLENTPDHIFNNRFVVSEPVVKTNAGVYSDPVGSGKTIVLLALVIAQPIPKNIDMTYGSDLAKKTVINELQMLNGQHDKSNTVTKTFKSILSPTIVFVGVSVINQWLDAVKRFTVLKYLVVSNVIGLEELLSYINNKTINTFDIIIIKNGKITRPVVLPSNVIKEDKNCGDISYIYNIMSNLRNICWARVIIDDFDTIGLPSSAGIVNGIFTWYISSTYKFIVRKIATNKQFKKTSEMIMYSNYSCSKIMYNAVLFHNFNVRNSLEFIKESNMIFKPIFYVYLIPNKNQVYLNLLGDINQNDVNEILEMLNGDAIATAADRLGIASHNVADLFETILGKQYDNYKKSSIILKFIEEQEKDQGIRKPMSDNPDEKDTYNKTDLISQRVIEYNYPNLKGLLEATKIEYAEINNKSGLALERVRSNIKAGECPICLNDFVDEDNIIIVKCCNVIICGSCCFSAIFTAGSQRGRCGNCRYELKIKDLIYMNKEINLEQVVQSNVIEEKQEEKKSEDEEKKSEDKEKYDTKMNYIHKIIVNGNFENDRKEIDVTINNLMIGDNIGEAPPYNKVLVFANYDETLNNIKIMLIDKKIKFWILHGSYSTIADTVRNFTDCTEQCVLIVNSMKHCSGLNLQSATDLIFTHRIFDKNIETQVIGRGQRIGRTSNLRVHYMLYENEYAHMR